MEYKTIVISDLHLGNPYSNWRLLKNFLDNNSCKNLFLNGDIIDDVHLISNNKELSKEENDFIDDALKKKDTNVVYIKGNHDRDKYVKTIDNYFYRSNGKSYFITHGHNTIFRNPFSSNPYILRLINSSILFLAKLQKIHRGIFFQKGKLEIIDGAEFGILSKNSRKFFKTTLKFLSKYKKKIRFYSDIYSVDVIISGHIHHPEIKLIDYNYLYMNSGDWIENNTALVESIEGKWSIIKWEE